MHSFGNKKLLMIKPSQIKIPSYRARRNIDERELKFLAGSISACGIIEPLTVRKNENGNFELIAGERRLKAAMKAGLRRVPCVVHNVNDFNALIYSISENVQRSNFTYFEEAETLSHLMFEYGVSQAEICAKLGINTAELCNKLRLARLDDELKFRITSEKLSQEFAYELLRLDYLEREAALNKIVCEGYSLKQAHQYINGILYPPMFEKEEQNTEQSAEEAKAHGGQTVKCAIGDMRLFSNSLVKLIDSLQAAGIKAVCRKSENDKYIEYKIKIKKEAVSSDTATQLRIC